MLVVTVLGRVVTEVCVVCVVVREPSMSDRMPAEAELWMGESQVEVGEVV